MLISLLKITSSISESFFFYFNQLFHFLPTGIPATFSVPYHYYEPFGPDECTMYLSHERGRRVVITLYHRKRVFKNWARTFNIHFSNQTGNQNLLLPRHSENKPVFWGIAVWPDKSQEPHCIKHWATELPKSPDMKREQRADHRNSFLLRGTMYRCLWGMTTN